jgi:hypothetical protein
MAAASTRAGVSKKVSSKHKDTHKSEESTVIWVIMERFEK